MPTCRRTAACWNSTGRKRTGPSPASPSGRCSLLRGFFGAGDRRLRRRTTRRWPSAWRTTAIRSTAGTPRNASWNAPCWRSPTLRPAATVNAGRAHRRSSARPARRRFARPGLPRPGPGLPGEITCSNAWHERRRSRPGGAAQRTDAPAAPPRASVPQRLARPACRLPGRRRVPLPPGRHGPARARQPVPALPLRRRQQYRQTGGDGTVRSGEQHERSASAP